MLAQFSISQGPSLCVCASLSQDRFQRRDLWVVDITYYGESREVSLTSRMRNMWSFISYLGRAQASSLDCPAIDILEFLSTGNEFQLFTLGGTHLSPASLWDFFFLMLFFLKLIYLFIDWLIDWLIAVLGLRFCARAPSSCGEQGPLFIVVRGPLTIAASLAAEHRLQTRRLSNCGSRA